MKTELKSLTTEINFKWVILELQDIPLKYNQNILPIIRVKENIKNK